MFRILAMSLGLLATGPAPAWQLAPMNLAEQVRASDTILLGRTEKILERTTSPIAGQGDEMTVRLRVERIIKGHAPATPIVKFVEAAVQVPPAFSPGTPRIWLLRKTREPDVFLAPAYFPSVLPAHQENAVSALANQPPSTLQAR